MQYQQVKIEKQDWPYDGQGYVTDFSDFLLRLETTNHCNFKCNFCPHSTMKRDKGFIDESLCERVIGEAAELGIHNLDLRNFGEPILDKRLSTIGKIASSNGFDHIYIHTNGMGINKSLLQQWGEAGINDVNISLSPKKEFAKSRPGTDVDKLFSQMENLQDSEWMHILSVDYIRTGTSSEQEEKEFNDWLIKFNLRKRIEINLHNWALGESKNEGLGYCHRLWSSITILWDGQVPLCCLDYEGEYNLGNLHNASLKDIINSELYREVRSNHYKGKYLSKCASCDMPIKKDK